MEQHEGGGTPRKNWWKRRSKKAKAIIVIGALIVIGVAMGSGSDPKESKSSASGKKVAAQSSAPASDAETIGVKTTGRFHRDCLGCGELADYIKTGNVWCAWQDDKVLVHVTMTNRSVEHVTVTWHPSYKLVGGAEHGAGLTSTEDSGFDAGETRDLISEQNPEGISAGAKIGECKPSFFLVQSG
jgi:hypothetical protein